jgi:hypothetical protein
MYSAPGDNATALPAVDVESSDASIGEFTLGTLLKGVHHINAGLPSANDTARLWLHQCRTAEMRSPSQLREPLAIGIEYLYQSPV